MLKFLGVFALVALILGTGFYFSPPSPVAEAQFGFNSGRMPKKPVPLDCNSGRKGNIYYDTDDDQILFCDASNWVVLQDNTGLLFEGATIDDNELLLQVSDPTADVTVLFRAGLDSADTYHALVVPDIDLTVADFMNPMTSFTTVAFAAAGLADDVLIVQRFYLPYPLTVITVDFTNIDIANASASDNTIAVAFYEDADAGVQIVEALGATDDGAGNAIAADSINIADTTFEPGWYRIAFCAQDASDNDVMTQTIHANVLLVMGGGTGEIVGTGANACVAGNPPDTTGAITNLPDFVPFILVTN